MAKEADSNIIFLIIIVIRILFLREVWGFRWHNRERDDICAKIPETPQTSISIFFKNAMVYYANMLIHSLDRFLGDFEWLESGVVPPR